MSRTKEQAREYNRRYYEKHKERLTEHQRAYYAANRDKQLGWQTDYYKQNKDALAVQRKARYQRDAESLKAAVRSYRATEHGRKTMRCNQLLKAYGLTLEEFTQMAEEQKYRCELCGDLKNGTGRNNVLHVDHDHERGTVRGLLCSKCNIGLGHFEDSPELLRAAAKYIERNLGISDEGELYKSGVLLDVPPPTDNTGAFQ